MAFEDFYNQNPVAVVDQNLWTDKIPEILGDTVILTPYGVDYRYPGEYPEVGMSDAERAFLLADRVRAEVRSRLPHHILE